MALGISLLASAPTARAQTIQEAIELHLSGRLDEALEAYRAVAAAAVEGAPQVAAAAHTNACVILMNRSEYEAALVECEAALVLRRQSDDRQRMAATLNNLGLTLQNLGRYREARERYLEALEINREADDRLSVSRNLSNLSGVAIQAGDYADALGRIDEVLRLAEANPEADWSASQSRIALLNEGVVLEKLGAFRAALESYRQALVAEGEIDEGLDALLKVNLGVAYRNLGDPVRAVELYEEAALAYRRLDNDSGLSNALLNIALARHLNLDQPEAAEVAYREALALAVSAGDRPEEIQDLFYLASLLHEQNRLDEAEQLFERALEVSEESGSAEGRWSSLAGLGRIAAGRGDLTAAQSFFERAFEVIEEVRAELTPDSHRADFFGSKRDLFRAAVQVAADLHRREPGSGHDAEAFELVQRAKARELLDALGVEGAGRPLGWQEIAEELESARVIEYFVAERELLRWTLDRRGLEMVALGPAAPILDAVMRVHRALAGGRPPADEDLALLSDRLLGGAEEALTGGLHIASDAALRYLPFELLPMSADGKRLLVDRATIGYLPSASTLASLDPAGTGAALRAVALADPMPEGAASISRPAELLAARFGLGALPESHRELASIERWLGGPATLLTGSSATELALRDATRDGARVVHLATHTVIDERPGRGAAVLLAASETDDGLLYPREIADLELRADLAVLAACQTALASEEGGGSITTLTGAFLAAGTRGVVATLWDVEDRVTATFMDQFYWQLSRGATAAEALRRTKQEFRRQPEWREPHLWAGYVLTGSAPPVVERRGLMWWIAGGLALAAVAIVVSRRRRR